MSSKSAECKSLELILEKVPFTVFSRPVSFNLKRELRKLGSELQRDLVKATAEMPDEIFEDKDGTKIGAKLRTMMKEDPKTFDKTLDQTERTGDAQDIITMRMCQTIVDLDRINVEAHRKKIEEPVIDKDGEVSPWWASQDLEAMERFVDSFR